MRQGWVPTAFGSNEYRSGPTAPCASGITRRSRTAGGAFAAATAVTASSDTSSCRLEGPAASRMKKLSPADPRRQTTTLPDSKTVVEARSSDMPAASRARSMAVSMRLGGVGPRLPVSTKPTGVRSRRSQPPRPRP